MQTKLYLGLTLGISFLGKVSSQACPNNCNGNGLCLNPGTQCVCFAGYTGGDCSLLTCAQGHAWADVAQGIDNAHNLAECSNMGVCDRTTGLCSCGTGFTGDACERRICSASTQSQCNGAGRCVSMSDYANSKDPGLGTVYTYTSVWDANQMYSCLCDSNFYGPECSLRLCPTGDDPLTGNGVNTAANPVQYNAIQKISCKAGAGTFTLTFLGKTTQAIPYNAQASDLAVYIGLLTTIGGSGNIKVALLGAQACVEAGTSFTVQFMQNFGPQPLFIPDPTNLYFSSAVTKVSLTVAVQQLGTKENDLCSNRGICDPATGYCTCSTNYATSNGYNAPGTRGDCGDATTTILACPGTVSCSAHGQCPGPPTYRCACDDGWAGADCSERSCPKDISWFDQPTANNNAHTVYAECSSMGTCDRSLGTCTCEIGFNGGACQYMSCPGTALQCNGQGTCLDMYALAAKATVNGNAAFYTYGATPNNPATWDATKIFGCYCDSGYTGYDCSLRTCPYGNDPNNMGLDEQQVLSCTGTSGTVIFSFRGQSTTAISATATRATVQAALQALSTIGTITVDYVSSTQTTDAMCMSSGSQFIITFLTDHGNLPLITYAASGTLVVQIQEYQAGTKEMVECSGRGLCDRVLGVCVCFTGLGSSDGMGNMGAMGDCGFREPVALVV